MSRSLFPMLLVHEVCHSSKIYLLIDGLKLENGILKEVGSNESDDDDELEFNDASTLLGH